MKQQAQTNLLIGIGAITAAVVAGYFGLDFLSGKKPPVSTVSASAPATSPAAESGEYAAAIAAATEGGDASTGSLTADEARRIGEQVAREVAAQVAQSIVGEGGGGGAAGLSEADARRIGEEEGRRVAEEVAAVAVQQALAALGGSTSSGGSGLSAAEAEQIGIAAGRRAAEQVAANTAREVVRNEFGGTVSAQASSSETAPAETAAAEESAPTETAPAAASAEPSSTAVASGVGSDALRAWWSAPASGDFGLVYAGQPKGEAAIALLFSNQPSDGTLNQSIRVYDAKGTLVSGSWEAASNPRLAVLRGLQPGRYTVVVEPTLADASGKAVNKGQHGPVYVL